MNILAFESSCDETSASVVFTDGEADRNEYRRFRIQTFEGADDFRSLQEVLAIINIIILMLEHSMMLHTLNR